MKYYLVMAEKEVSFPWSGTCNYAVPHMLFTDKKTAMEYFKSLGGPFNNGHHILVIEEGQEINIFKECYTDYDIERERERGK